MEKMYWRKDKSAISLAGCETDRSAIVFQHKDLSVYFINPIIKERQVLPKPLMQQKPPSNFFLRFPETSTLLAFVWDLRFLGFLFCTKVPMFGIGK